MGAKRNDILQGTLALLVLQTLASGRNMHGYACVLSELQLLLKSTAPPSDLPQFRER
jgi:hypothetical protein